MDREKIARRRFEIAVQTRNFEIELFWKRALFFWGFIAVAFGGYATLRTAHSDLAIVVACFGTVCSFAWTLANRGSKYWQEAWESKVERFELSVIGSVFGQEEDVQTNKGCWLQSRRYSVSKLSVVLSDYACALWIAVLIAEFCKFLFDYMPLRSLALITFVAISAGFVVALFRSAKSSERSKVNGLLGHL